jgi:hypothetical protein
MSGSGLKMFQTPVSAGESQEEFLSLLRMVAESYEPCNAYELFLVSRMAALHWRLLRLQNHESRSLSIERARHMIEGGSRHELMLPGEAIDDASRYTALEARIGKLISDLRAEFHVSQQRRERQSALSMKAKPEIIETRVTALLGAKELTGLEQFDLAESSKATE